MTFHKAKEESKWKQWKEQEERILRKSGVIPHMHIDQAAHLIQHFARAA